MLVYQRSNRDDDLAFATLLMATILIAPHFSVYDLVLVVPALLIVADRAVAGETSSKWLWPALSMAYLLPLWSTVALLFFVQPMVLCLTWLVIDVTRTRRPEDPARVATPLIRRLKAAGAGAGQSD